MRQLAAMLRFAVIIMCAAVAVGTAAADSVDDYVRKLIDSGTIPSVSIAVMRNGEVVKIKGYGFANLEHKVAATPETIYQSGSMGKQFTAAGILLLVEDGKLGLDDRLAMHFPDGPSSWHRIKIRHLLTHTSGLKDYGPDEFDIRKDYSEGEALAIIKRIPIEFEPGTQWSYSNTGYMLLGILTSRLTGMHWSEFQSKRLFEPLGMTTTRLISERDLVLNRAAGYIIDDKGEVKNQWWASPSTNQSADGTLYFSAKDLAAWDAALYARKFLKPESFEAWWTPVQLANGTTAPYGFGWWIKEQRGKSLIEHAGYWQGFGAVIARYMDEGLTVVVLANSSHPWVDVIAHQIAGLVDPSLRLPDASSSKSDPESNRAAHLTEVLEAWATYRSVPNMAKGLAETAAGTRREADKRAEVGEQLTAMTAFRYLAVDDLTGRPITMRGEKVERIAYYALDTKDSRHIYRFQLTQDGRVVNFDSETR